ncbi:MAG: hypothetical protein Q7T50_05620 [Candidatus Magasanikbacteria bacterium]|nr:hypothetical protein [Candidatus Magasanikbacteria bacterium]
MTTKKVKFKKVERGKQFSYPLKGVKGKYLKLLFEYIVSYENDFYPVNIVALANGQLFYFEDDDIVEIEEDNEDIQ